MILLKLSKGEVQTSRQNNRKRNRRYDFPEKPTADRMLGDGEPGSERSSRITPMPSSLVVELTQGHHAARFFSFRSADASRAFEMLSMATM
jgi:hypothetical protein